MAAIAANLRYNLGGTKRMKSHKKKLWVIVIVFQEKEK